MEQTISKTDSQSGASLLVVTGSEVREDERGYKGTVSTHILKILLGELKEQVKKKIDKLNAFGVEETPPMDAWPRLERDAKVRGVLAALAEVTKHHPTALAQAVRALLQWRAHQQLQVPTLPETSGGSSLRALATLKTRRVERAAGWLLEERAAVAVDGVVAETLAALLPWLSRDALDDSLAAALESVAFEHFRPRDRRSPADDLRRLVADQYAVVLGLLSKYRLKAIAQLFFKDPLPVHSSKTPAFTVQGIRFLKLKITTRHSLESSVEFVSNFWNLLSKTSRSETKQTMSDTLVSILRILIESLITNGDGFRSNLVYTDWFSLMQRIYESTEPKRKRKSGEMLVLVVHPLIPASLSPHDCISLSL